MSSRKLFALVVAVWGLAALPALAQTGPGAGPAPAQFPRPVAPVVIKQLRDNVYVALGGAGGVSGVIVGDKGVIVINAKQTPDSATQTIARISEITAKPVTSIILTGSGGEDIPGLAAFPAGLKIIAHADTEMALEKMAANNAPRKAPPDKMPNIIVKKDRNLLNLEGVRVVLLHIAPSHTSGESAVYLPDQRVVFTGYVVQSPSKLSRYSSRPRWISGGMAKVHESLDHR